MKSLALASLLTLGLVSNLAQSSALKFDERQLLDLASRQLGSLEELLGDDNADSEPETKRNPKVGLQFGTLATSTLQPGKGMGCAAGLTPNEEWRRMFPRKEQR